MKQQPEITLNGRTLTIAETPISDGADGAASNGRNEADMYLFWPDEAASQLVGEKIRLAMKLEDGGCLSN